YAQWPALRRAAQAAYGMAGIAPREVDLAEVHDCFAIAEFIACEELGFCGKGEAGAFVAAGRGDYGGDVVVNPRGGLIGCGHPLGATGGGQAAAVDVKARTTEERRAVFGDARREITRDLRLMTEEGVIAGGDVASALDRIEDRTGLDGLDACAFVQEALPELFDLKREVLGRLATRVGAGAIIASTSSTIAPRHLADAVERPERFLVAHWLNPAHIVPLVEVVAGQATAAAGVDRAIEVLEALGKVPVRC